MSSFYLPTMHCYVFYSVCFSLSIMWLWCASALCVGPHSIFNRVSSLMQYIRSNCYLNSCYYFTWFHVNNIQLTDHFSLSFDRKAREEKAKQKWLSIDVSPADEFAFNFCFWCVWCLWFLRLFFFAFFSSFFSSISDEILENKYSSRVAVEIYSSNLRIIFFPSK